MTRDDLCSPVDDGPSLGAAVWVAVSLVLPMLLAGCADPSVQPRVFKEGNETVAAYGGVGAWAVELEASGNVSYRVSSLDGSSVSVCLLDDEQLQTFREGERPEGGRACRWGVEAATGAASLPGGRHHLAVRCLSDEPCEVHVFGEVS